MAESQTYDLLQDDREDAIFRIIFDLYTARPHFILLPKPGKVLERDHSLTTEQKQQLIAKANKMLSFYGISCGTLSIHRGSWISKKSLRAHFHLCVDAKTYLAILVQKGKYHEVNKRFFGNFSKMVEEYPVPKYHKKEVGKILHIISKSASNSSPEEQSASENTENLLYHPEHPKIGFPGDGTTEEGLRNILIEMEEYAERNNLTTINSKNEDDGCHLCLNLGSGTYFGKIKMKCVV